MTALVLQVWFRGHDIKAFYRDATNDFALGNKEFIYVSMGKKTHEKEKIRIKLHSYI